MKLTILGCHSATPRINRNPTAQVLEIRNHLILIDCGEGTQVELRRNKIKFSRIQHIFISHLHGDHYYGLIGLISTFQLLNRSKDLHIYGPQGLKEVIMLQLKLAKSWSKFQLIFHELSNPQSELVFEDDHISVHTIPLRHRVYTNGFLFREKLGERKLNLPRALEANIDKSYFRKLKKGFDVENKDGVIIRNETVTLDPSSTKSYAYCSDTAFNAEMVKIINECSVLYHEATFLERHKELSGATKHSTAKQAAEIAKMANVKRLILGHFSTRYDALDDFINEASQIFDNVELAADGKSFTFD